MNDFDEIRATVREGYAKAATAAEGCCGPGSVADQARRIGYEEEDVRGPAAEGNLGLGCGNPTALAGLAPGEVVVDLGSGAGFDGLLAAPRLGPEGRFIGVDMTPEMLARARENAVRAGLAQTVEFREGLIEALPVTSESVDVVISNCVINLSPDKGQVFREAFRVLKAGGRLAVSDIVLSEPLPAAVAELGAGWVACVSGALVEEEYLDHVRAAGFADVQAERTPAGGLLAGAALDPTVKAAVATLGSDLIEQVAETVFSLSVTARRP